MIDRKFVKSLIDQIPEDRLVYVAAFLQGAAVPNDATDGEVLESIMQQAENHRLKNSSSLQASEEIPLGNTFGGEYHGKEIPYWKKYTLSIEEAATYFRIGRNKLRKIINENPDADFVLWNNTRPQIKREKFEAYIDKLNTI